MPDVIRLDIAKRIFQIHPVNSETGEIVRMKLRRSEMADFFCRREHSVVVMEACGSSHYWARTIREFGHEVRLIATKFVRPFVKGNKTDASDAEAIWEAGQLPGMRFVPVKTEHQQAVLALHSMRDGLVKARTAQINQIRATLAADHVHSALRDLADEHWASALPLLLEDFQQLLRDALDLLRELGEADDHSDRSHWD
ncbi:IS110 family transposase [Paraburkholderia phymatum]|uniref:IS110 family transposase n=1 Tax=Paraburkholderia phymatum TaxID=148447 RepID=A0ACC6UD86_9BURK